MYNLIFIAKNKVCLLFKKFQNFEKNAQMRQMASFFYCKSCKGLVVKCKYSFLKVLNTF
jgi:hypothetical protein